MSSLAPPPGLSPEEAQFLQKSRIAFLGVGGLLAVIGVVALYESFFFTIFSILLLGLLLFFAGAAQTASAVLAHRERGFAAHLFAGIVKLIVGLVMIRHPGGAADAVTLMIAVVFLISGSFLIVAAARERFHGWLYFLVNGVLNIFMGLIIWNSWPSSGDWVIGLFIGLELLYIGATWILLALALPTPTPPTA